MIANQKHSAEDWGGMPDGKNKFLQGFSSKRLK
jgi:hypothetical protein